MTTLDPIAVHVAGTTYADLPASAVARVRTFLLDTLGVGIAGSSGHRVAEVTALARTWAPQEEATVWLTGERMGAQSAASANAYRIQCLECDCVHEGAVLHPMATILSAVLAWAERATGQGRPVDGSRLVSALALGTDVSTLLGMATDAPIRFFRPATAGGLGAAAALAHLAGLDATGVKDALGAQYAQMSGTLQPHVEGSPMLGLQVGFNARAALASVDLAEAGLRGPHDILTGPYGYFPLFEMGDEHLGELLPTLGRDWQIEAMSHKPWPSGRLTHGAVDGLGRLMEEHRFAAADVAGVTVEVPPLNFRLVGRPLVPRPEANYAKLCLRFVAGVFLAKGRVDVPDFRGAALSDPEVHRYAGLVDVVQNATPDQNALDPQTVRVRLHDGRELVCDLPRVKGHPQVPLTADENRDKFRRCAGYGSVLLPADRAEALIAAVERVEEIEDVALLPRLTLAGPEAVAA